MLTTGRRFSPRCVLVSVMVPSPSMIPARYAASVSDSFLSGSQPRVFTGLMQRLRILPANLVKAQAGNLPCLLRYARRFPAVQAGNRLLGGGGGTAHPWLSPRAGLCLRPRTAEGSAWTRSVLSSREGQLDPSARPRRCAVGGSMSLYRAGLRLALFLPLDVAMPPLDLRGAVRFRRCELRYQPNLAIWRDPRSNPRP